MTDINSNYDPEKEAYTYNHIDVKIQLTKVVRAVQEVRDTGAALFDRALDWYSEEDQVKTLDTVTGNTKSLSKIDGLCNYLCQHLDKDTLYAVEAKMEKFDSMSTDEIIDHYKKVTDSLRKEVVRLESMTIITHPTLEAQKPIMAFVVDDIKGHSKLVYESLDVVEKAHDLNKVRLAISRGEDIQPKHIGAAIPRK
ncbi:hypothetical protein LXA54_17180 [Erwinia amylovora]|uniref:hypothetical protein n=1 Tax=Erwinia amylovora TaxID=552 RepID=UPI0020C1219A|nr:hypothetical protein [Erwinia amylovora]MCK8336024.1 hypothetical protein [Erwinia amylovora]